MSTSQISAFGATDWIVLVAFLLGTTWFGHALRGKSQSTEDFFAAGRNLPWWAVSASLVATTASALTFIAVPAAVFRPGGDFTFVQMTIGFVAGNFLLAHTLLKDMLAGRFLSPYDFIESRLDVKSAHLARALFVVGAVMSQGVRLLSTALVLSVVTGLTLVECILIMGIFAVFWTWMGGIQTVVWTDFLQLVVFGCGALLILLNVFSVLPKGIGDIVRILDESAKLRFLDISLDPRKTYTLWVGLIGATIFEFSQKSIDQVTTQRLFCCRSLADARKALYGAAFGVSLVYIMLAVGAGLVAYYYQFPMPLADAEMIAAQPDRIVPYFIVNQLPTGVSGLLIASLFAAGISTADSALAALAQTTTTGVYRRYVATNKSELHYVSVSRVFVLSWGVILCGLAIVFERYQERGLLQLGLAVPGYVYGSILGVMLLAYYRIGTFRPILAGTFLSVLLVIWLQSHGVAFFWWYPAAAIVVICATIVGKHLARHRT